MIWITLSTTNSTVQREIFQNLEFRDGLLGNLSVESSEFPGVDLGSDVSIRRRRESANNLRIKKDETHLLVLNVGVNKSFSIVKGSREI